MGSVCVHSPQAQPPRHCCGKGEVCLSAFAQWLVVRELPSNSFVKFLGRWGEPACSLG